MGMMACYQEANTTLIESLKTKSNEALFEEIENLQEDGKVDVYSMDKLWDGLHCLLTGVSASKPIENDLLSEAIVGTAVFHEVEDTDFISYIYLERLREILSAMYMFDIDQALFAFSPMVFAKKKIYPNIWADQQKESLQQELLSAFCGLKQFYRKVVDKRAGIVVSIY